jgi:DNA-binding transcriptional LysR family regulator
MPCITFESLAINGAWIFANPEGRGEVSVIVRSRLSVNTPEAAVDAAIAGLGLTQVLSYQIARTVDAGKLKIVLRKFEQAPIPVSIIHPGQGLLPLKTRSFLEFAAPRLRRALGD